MDTDPDIKPSRRERGRIVTVLGLPFILEWSRVHYIALASTEAREPAR